MAKTIPTVRVTYVGDHDVVMIPGLDVERGQTVEVPADLAGAAPTDTDPYSGWGLLGSPVWQRAGGRPGHVEPDPADPAQEAAADQRAAHAARDTDTEENR